MFAICILAGVGPVDDVALIFVSTCICNFIICHLFVAFSNSGELVVPKEFSLNKIGHGRYVIN